jgi:RsiW-degrading membrane proteinase PrsW (M82 family)
MVAKFNIISFILIVLPPFLYAWIIYLSSPYKSLSLKDSTKFILGGVFSITTLSFISFLFPYWSTYAITDPFWGSFWVTAPKEELSKFLLFLIIYKGLNNSKNLHPITYMFYFGMIGLGFAMVENLSYVVRYGVYVLKFRTFGAVFVHMICGMLFGYWLGISKIKKSKFTLRTISSIYLSSRPKTKIFLYTLMGLITSSCFHGLWNYNINIWGIYSTPFSILLLMVGFLACKLLSRDLINQHQKSIKVEAMESRMDRDLDKI